MEGIVRKLVRKNWNSNWNENMVEEDMVQWVMKFAHALVREWLRRLAKELGG